MNANCGHEHQSIVSSLSFHPREDLLMTSGLDRKVKIFQVKGVPQISADNYNNVNSSKKSQKLQSIFLPDLPIFSSKFILDGSQALLTGNRKHFYSYDMEKNKLEKHTVGNLDQKNLSTVSVGD